MKQELKESTQEQSPARTRLYRLQMRTRFWWTEILRGVLTLTFGVLYLSLQNLIYVLIYILGAYLLCDGILDLYHAHTRKHAPQRDLNLYLGASLSIVLGVVSLFAPLMTLFLSGIFIATMIVLRGMKAIVEVLRSDRRSNVARWTYGLILVMCGLILFLPPILTLTTRLLVSFIGIYALSDGLYLLMRGFRLWLKPSLFLSVVHRVTKEQLDIPRGLPRTTRRAIIFVRRSGAAGLGHISWAFEWRNGWFNVGSIENRNSHAITPAELADFWTAHTTNPLATIQKFGQGYDEYKIFYVTQPRPKAAWRTLVWASRRLYLVIRRNCVDATYDVLRTYGVADLPDPATQYAPNDWYDSLAGFSYAINLNPTLPTHIRAKHKLVTTETLLTIPAHVIGTPPPWREQGLRGLAEISLVWRRMVSDVRTSIVAVGKFIAEQ